MYLDTQNVPGVVFEHVVPNKLVAFSKFLGKVEMEDKFREDERVVGVLARQFEVFDYDGKVGCAKNKMLDL